MSIYDWLVLTGTLAFIVIYGIWKSRGDKNIEGYLRGENSMPWFTVGLSIMATQASAITFLSAPGQAYVDGMRFVQFYFGLPVAMVVLSVTAVPIYHRLKVFTAYEYLETRFDLKTRSLAAFLFLIQRGLAAGLTIYAPSIILSSILDWNIYYTNLFMGGLVCIYTISGGTKAVSITQTHQMAVIFIGMFIAGYMIIQSLPEEVSFGNAVKMAGKMGRLNIIDYKFDWNNRYTIWSGLIGGFFLSLSYFGTDQSQVGRYLTGKSIAQSRLGLLFNGLIKIPMQFSILFIGAMLFVLYQFEPTPVFFNKGELEQTRNEINSDQIRQIEREHQSVAQSKKSTVFSLNAAIENQDARAEKEALQSWKELDEKQGKLRSDLKSVMSEAKRDSNDTNYIFLDFVMRFLPQGLIGLLIAVIFSASMSSTSSELNSLASTSVVDIYKRSVKKDGSETHYLQVSKLATLIWGAYAIGVAMFATRMGSLIEAVNILGSLFYGTILGIFLVAFYMKKINGGSTFFAAIISEIIVLLCYKFTGISFLWYNLIGCVLVMFLSQVFSMVGLGNIQTDKSQVEEKN